jgi:TolB-like protein
MTSDNDNDVKRGRAARTAAQWFVELDAGSAEPAKEAALAAWLEESPAHERELERCEAAVHLAQALAHDADVQWAFDEAARLAAAPPPREAAPPRVIWYQRPALSWSIAAVAVVVAVVAAVWRVSPSPTAPMTAVAFGEGLPPEIVIELASADPVVVLPGQIIVDARSVAVLPFVGVADRFAETREGAATNAIAAQLYDDVVRQLATIPGVYVVGRPSVVPYENRDIRPEEVAAQLGVRGIVAARVAIEDGRVRVLLQVIDVAGDGVLSEDAFDRPVAELIAMRTDIVTNIAVALASPAGPVEPTTTN